MAFGRRSRGRRGSYPRAIVTSIKNSTSQQFGLTTALVNTLIAKAVTTPDPTVATDVSHGCIIKAVWIEFWVEGNGATGVLNSYTAYLIKNPGANLTPPNPVSVGTSNEKKYVFRQWKGLMPRIQDGSPMYHWSGWIKIPKRYQRFGTDDTLNFVAISAITGGQCLQTIYKWYR